MGQLQWEARQETKVQISHNERTYSMYYMLQNISNYIFIEYSYYSSIVIFYNWSGIKDGIYYLLMYLKESMGRLKIELIFLILFVLIFKTNLYENLYTLYKSMIQKSFFLLLSRQTVIKYLLQYKKNYLIRAKLPKN